MIFAIYTIYHPSPPSHVKFDSSFSFSPHLEGSCDMLSALLEKRHKLDTAQALRSSPPVWQGGDQEVASWERRQASQCRLYRMGEAIRKRPPSQARGLRGSPLFSKWGTRSGLLWKGRKVNEKNMCFLLLGSGFSSWRHLFLISWKNNTCSHLIYLNQGSQAASWILLDSATLKKMFFS